MLFVSKRFTSGFATRLEEHPSPSCRVVLHQKILWHFAQILTSFFYVLAICTNFSKSRHFLPFISFSAVFTHIYSIFCHLRHWPSAIPRAPPYPREPLFELGFARVSDNLRLTALTNHPERRANPEVEGDPLGKVFLNLDLSATCGGALARGCLSDA